MHEEILRVLHELHTTMKTYHNYQGELRSAEAKLRSAELSKTKFEQSIPQEKLERSKKFKLLVKDMMKVSGGESWTCVCFYYSLRRFVCTFRFRLNCYFRSSLTVSIFSARINTRTRSWRRSRPAMSIYFAWRRPTPPFTSTSLMTCRILSMYVFYFVKFERLQTQAYN